MPVSVMSNEASAAGIVGEPRMGTRPRVREWPNLNDAHEGKKLRVDKLSTDQIIRHGSKTGGPACTYSVLPLECVCDCNRVLHLWDVNFVCWLCIFFNVPS